MCIFPFLCINDLNGIPSNGLLRSYHIISLWIMELPLWIHSLTALCQRLSTLANTWQEWTKLTTRITRVAFLIAPLKWCWCGNYMCLQFPLGSCLKELWKHHRASLNAIISFCANLQYLSTYGILCCRSCFYWLQMGEKRLWIAIISCLEIIVYILEVGNYSMCEQKACISFLTVIHFLLVKF